MTPCNVCGNRAVSGIFESSDSVSITTMNKLVNGKTEIFFCDECGHLQTSELPNLTEYYAQEYEINLSSEDDDQLYKIVDGKPVYRADHQAAVLMSKINFPAGSRVLDYGCAKSPTLKKVLVERPDIEPFLFDVTDKYVPFWTRFPKMPQWSIHQPNAAWRSTMDAVLSFYALEHVANLGEAIGNIKALLRPGGTFYFLVPNIYQNVADFIVADHVNHFSKSSLLTLLRREGFVDIEIDDSSHDAAFVVSAILAPASLSNCVAPVVVDIAGQRQAALDMAQYWKEVTDRIREFEASIGDSPAAVYGAGFYGSFITSVLRYPDRINCVIDQNKYLWGTSVNGKRVTAPATLPTEITYVLIGLNPRNARTSIDAIQAWQGRDLVYFFL